VRRVSGAGLRDSLSGFWVSAHPVVCSSIGHPDRGFESLKDCAASAALGFGWLSLGFCRIAASGCMVVCSSIGHRDRGFESLKDCAASAALGFGIVFLGFSELRLRVVWLSAHPVVCSSIGHPDRGFESLKDCAASAALGFGRLFLRFCRIAASGCLVVCSSSCLLIHRSS